MAIVRYLHPDHLSGTSVVTDQTGGMVESIDYYPYGSARVDTKWAGYGGEKRKFIGQEFDTQSGLSFLNARYYNGNRAQFISQDPVFWEKQNLLDPQSLNSYSYANGNPINKSDPMGKTPADAFATAYITGAYAVGQFFTLGVGQLMRNQFLINQSTQNLSVALNPENLGASLTLANEAPPVAGTFSVAGRLFGTKSALTGVQANRAQGLNFQAKEFVNFQKEFPLSAEEVTIKTESGVKTRVDMIGQKGSSFCIRECKSSATAPLTKNQSAAFPEIQKTGGTVVGEGKSGFPGGTFIPPTTPQVKRP